jgi:hypothetical protein
VSAEEPDLELLVFLVRQELRELVELVCIEFKLLLAEAEGEFQMS